MIHFTKEEYVHLLHQSTGFPRGSSKYRGVTLQKCGRWKAQFSAKKLGPLSSIICILYIMSFLCMACSFCDKINLIWFDSPGTFIWVCLTPRLKLQGITLFTSQFDVSPFQFHYCPPCRKSPRIWTHARVLTFLLIL